MQTVTRKTLAEGVAEQLQAQIRKGVFKPHEKLPVEAALMQRFAVGRSTVREAVRMLANAGFLRVQQGLGTFVEPASATQEPLSRRLKRADNKELNEVRELLEMKIAEKAAGNRSRKDITLLQKHLAQRKTFAEKGLLEACIDADIDFHLAIAAAAKNEVMADMFRAFSLHLRKWFLQAHSDTGDFVLTHALHQELLDSIVAGDSKKAWQCSARIIGHVSE